MADVRNRILAALDASHDAAARGWSELARELLVYAYRLALELLRARVERGRRDLRCDRFVMGYNGSGSGLTGRSIDRPIGTVTAADRWGVVDGDRMRMLSLDETRAAMGFPVGYEAPPTRDAWTEMYGNAVVPVVAAAALRAVMEAA